MNDVDQRLADLLRPTLLAGPGLVCDASGRIAVLPLREPTPLELADACVVYHLLGRGLLVLA